MPQNRARAFPRWQSATAALAPERAAFRGCSSSAAQLSEDARRELAPPGAAPRSRPAQAQLAWRVAVQWSRRLPMARQPPAPAELRPRAVEQSTHLRVPRPQTWRVLAADPERPQLQVAARMRPSAKVPGPAARMVPALQELAAMKRSPE